MASYNTCIAPTGVGLIGNTSDSDYDYGLENIPLTPDPYVVWSVLCGGVCWCAQGTGSTTMFPPLYTVSTNLYRAYYCQQQVCSHQACRHYPLEPSCIHLNQAAHRRWHRLPTRAFTRCFEKKRALFSIVPTHCVCVERWCLYIADPTTAAPLTIL